MIFLYDNHVIYDMCTLVTKIGHISIQLQLKCLYIKFYWYKMKYWELRGVMLCSTITYIFLKETLQKKNLL